MVFKYDECVFVGCRVYSVVDSQFCCDDFVFCMDFLCGAGLCLFVRLCDVLVQEVVVCCWLEFVEVCCFVDIQIYINIYIKELKKVKLHDLSLQACFVFLFRINIYIYIYIYIKELKKVKLHDLSLQACFVSNSLFRRCWYIGIFLE